MKTLLSALLLVIMPLRGAAQVGEYRNDFSVGGGIGVAFNSVGFTPKVSQGMHAGPMAGVTVRYVCEKYYSMICSIVAEVNYASLGWKEEILDAYDKEVINPTTGKAEEYSRTISYVQVPIFAHLAWGKEHSGCNFFFRAGPQLGVMLGESSSANFNVGEPNMTDRSNPTIKQYSMDVERKFDYGIAGGLGLEYTAPNLGHFLLEGRYYYGLGNIFKDSKRDYFGKSNHSTIMIKLTYLTDVFRKK
ncbi:MAG: PorT family protein [Prevotella sp.]|nr:PorT family protein [Prevotella sp.]